MRKKLIAGNWKMNLGKQEALNLIDNLLRKVENCLSEIVICPPYVYLESIRKKTLSSKLHIGSQNMFYKEWGAFTGEISAPMLKSIGCTHVILGHSERRRYFQEKDMDINRKIKIALEYGLIPIFCVGETLDQRKNGHAEDVLNSQIVYGLMGIDDAEVKDIIIAYEPVWAIGTGMSATGHQAEEMHLYIRSIIENFSGELVSKSVRIIYGGSVTPENTPELLQNENIDGLLVGGASLNGESFFKIIEISDSLCKIQPN